MNLESFIISKESTILQAMEKMSELNKDLLFVCDNFKLESVVTTNSIIRYLISGSADNNILEASIKETPKLYLSNRSNAKNLLKNSEISGIPILDREDNIIEIIFSNGKSIKRESNINVPVMVSMHDDYDILNNINISKEKEIISDCIENFSPYFCDDFTFLINSNNSLEKFILNETKKDLDSIKITKSIHLGESGALKSIADQIKDTFIICSPYTTINYPYDLIYKHHKSSGNLVTIVTTTKIVEIPYEILDVDQDHKISLMQTHPRFTFMISTGFYIMEHGFLEYIPKDPTLSIEALIKICLRSGQKVGIMQIPESCYCEKSKKQEDTI